MVCVIALMNAWDCHVCVSMYIHMYVCTWSVDSREIVFTDKQELPNSRLLPYIETLSRLCLHITFLYSRSDFLSVFIILRLSLIIITVAIKHET